MSVARLRAEMHARMQEAHEALREAQKVLGDKLDCIESVASTTQARKDALTKIAKSETPKRVHPSTQEPPTKRAKKHVANTAVGQLARDILTMNIGGKLRKLKRSLGMTIPESKLAWMCSGRWDHLLPRDINGRIFLDLDIEWVDPILDYLRQINMPSENSMESCVPGAHLEGDELTGFRIAVEYLGLAEHFFPIRKVGGELETMPKTLGFAGSTILSRTAAEQIVSSTSGFRDWQSKESPTVILMYKGSRDGFDAASFHRICDGSKNTLTIIRDTCGNVFGGYTDATLSSSNSYVASSHSFLFSSMQGGRCNYQIFPVKPEAKGNAVYCNANAGPQFGTAPDLGISNHCNTNPSTVNMGTVYDPGDQDAHVLTNGKREFFVSEIEVWGCYPQPRAKFFLDSIFAESLLQNLQATLPRSEIRLLYCGTEHGFAASDFHARCDGQPNTITFIKDSVGNVFGGFADTPFSSNQSYAMSNNAWLFSLERRGSTPCFVTFPVYPNKPNGIYCHNSFGPTFGANHDLHIADMSNRNSSSYVNIGNTYNPLGRGPHFLTNGSKNFQVAEIEVWQVHQGPSIALSSALQSKVSADSLEAQLLETGCTVECVYTLQSWFQRFVCECKVAERIVEHDRLVLQDEERAMQTMERKDEIPLDDSDFAGLINGILHFDVGGETICTMQQTLGYFSGSMLEVKYASGRWEESNWELDESGYVFEDTNHFCFRKLINVMRMRSMQHDVLCHSPVTVPRKHQQEMSRMLRYYQIPEQELLGYGCVFRLSRNAVRAVRTFADGMDAQWELVYRGSRDGFEAATFHRLCDGRENTVTMVEDTNGNLFGGYTRTAWDSTNQNRSSPQVFLFSLSRGGVETLEALYSTQPTTICCHQQHGPGFTGGFIISDLSNTKSSTVGTSFDSSGKPGCYVTNGAQSFMVSDIEVWTIMFGEDEVKSSG